MNSPRFPLALRRKVLILSAVALLPPPFSRPAHAQSDAIFKALDMTEDGWLSGTELQNGRWLKYDTNGDKEVTREEFAAGYARENGENAPPAKVAPARRAQRPAPRATTRPATARPPQIKLAAVRRQTNSVVGRCVKTNGQPLRGVRIRIYGVTYAGQNVNYSTTTGADGRYAVRVPSGNYHVGWAHFDAPAPSGPAYALPLYPVDGNIDDAPSAPGIVENFVLKMSGRISPLKEATSDLSYYGGSIQVSGGGIEGARLFDDQYFRFPAGSSLELTLTSRGALADGLPAKPLTLRKTARNGGVDTFLDIPLASYAVVARLIGVDGSVTPLRVAVSRVGSGTSPIFFSPTAADYGASGNLYFSSKGDGIPLLSYGGVSGAQISVLP